MCQEVGTSLQMQIGTHTSIRGRGRGKKRGGGRAGLSMNDWKRYNPRVSYRRWFQNLLYQQLFDRDDHFGSNSRFT